jgi:hypothetical protein
MLMVLMWIVTIIALIYAEENWRGRRAWNKQRQLMEARGEQLDLKAFIPKPVPAEQNFAATPFIKSWFKKDENGALLETPQEHWTDDFSRMNKGPSYPQEKSPRRFVDLVAWAKAFEGTRAGERWTYQASQQLDSASRSNAAAGVLEGLKSSEPRLEELRVASQRPYSRYPVFYDLENPWGILLPHLAMVKATCVRVQLKACAELAAGQSQGALDDVKLILYLADSIKEEPFLISYLVRIACLRIATQPIWEGLAEHRWSDVELGALIAQLQQYNFVADLKRPLESERAAGILTADLLYRKRYHLSDLVGETSQESFGGTFANVFAWIIPHGWYYQEQRNYCRLHETQFAGAIDAPAKRVFPKEIAAHAKEFQHEIAGGRFGKTLHGVLHHQTLAGLLLPSLENIPRRAASGQTSADQAALACALERYRLANGQFPEKLEALAPRFLPQLPHDVFTGGPYQYRREGNSFILYSIGWNETDDGGTPGKDLVDFKAGDWVWEYPRN